MITRFKMWMVFLMCCFIIIGVVSNEVLQSKLVHTAQGPVLGYKDPVEDIFVFYGIPYAKAPTGLNKFKAPLPPPMRSITLEAVDQGIVCPQYEEPMFGINIKNKTKQEDCLIVNIYTPNTEDINLPVIVYVHGGGFIVGYGDQQTPKKIVSNKKIIAVTFNYRLAAHGFLCLGTSDIPGNAGMKDQVALLRWVQNNIAKFGGNPGDVTIAGYSAGSSSVGLLMISKMATGLFTKVIMESGAITSPYTMQVNPIQNAKEYAKLLNFENVDNITALELFYRNISYDLLQSQNTIIRPDSNLLVTPCIERDVGQEIFLKASPLSILKDGDFTKVPILIGFSNMEGLLHFTNFEPFREEMNVNFTNVVPVDLKFSSIEEKDKVAAKIKDMYFGKNLVSTEKILKYIDFFTDTMFVCPTLRTVKEIVGAGNGNTYLFEYSFVDEDSTPPVPYTDVRGAGHCAETFAVLDPMGSDENSISDKLKDWMMLMRETWYKFIQNGKPASLGLPEWRPVTRDNLTYMALKEFPEISISPNKEACSFWDELYYKYYQHPAPPYSVAPEAS